MQIYKKKSLFTGLFHKEIPFYRKKIGGNIESLIDEDDIHSIAEELWLDCISEPGRVFYEKYIVVGFDGHIPSCAYVQGVIEYLGGNSSNYFVAYNDGDSVKEIPCNIFLLKE